MILDRCVIRREGRQIQDLLDGDGKNRIAQINNHAIIIPIQKVADHLGTAPQVHRMRRSEDRSHRSENAN